MNDELDKLLTHEYNRHINNIKKRKYTRDNTLVGAHSKFNKKLHEKYDIPARNKLKRILGDFLIDNPDDYQQDMIIVSDICKYKFLEIQVCATWVNEDYPFDKLFVYERKGKYNNDTLFITMNKFLTRGIIFDRSSFIPTPRRLCRYSREFVYDIPWHLSMNVLIDHLDKETFELF
jgi:hypothetical protein